MKTVLFSLLLVFALPAVGQNAPAGKQTTKARPAPSEAVLRAAASTNFAARCAIDYNWKTATNAIAKCEAAIKVLDKKVSETSEKIRLTRQTHGDINALDDQDANYRNQRQAERVRLAQMKLQKIQAEEHLKKLYPNLR